MHMRGQIDTGQLQAMGAFDVLLEMLLIADFRATNEARKAHVFPALLQMLMW